MLKQQCNGNGHCCNGYEIIPSFRHSWKGILDRAVIKFEVSQTKVYANIQP